MKQQAMLDNPVWYSLTGPHTHLSIGDDNARRYPSDVFLAAATKNVSETALLALKRLVGVGESIFIFDGASIADSEGWELQRQVPCLQMVCDELITPQRQIEDEVIEIIHADIPDILELVELTSPGAPFLARTIELGNHIGIRQNGRLVAMAGEHLRFDLYCGISSVCTHPDFQGRGYGPFLSWKIAQAIIDRGEYPFYMF